MRKKAIFRTAAYSFLISGCALALPGCGGENDEDRTTTVGRVMAPTFFGAIPSPGDGRRYAEGLRSNGVEPLKTQCGIFGSGSVASVGIYGEVTVLVDISSRDLERANALGFFEADERFMTRALEVFDCESRSF